MSAMSSEPTAGLGKIDLIVVPADLCISEDTDAPSLALNVGNIKNFGMLRDKYSSRT